jgi:hypothetical protein
MKQRPYRNVNRALFGAQALVLRGARRLTLAFSRRYDAGTVGADPVGHCHYRLRRPVALVVREAVSINPALM